MSVQDIMLLMRIAALLIIDIGLFFIIAIAAFVILRK